MVKDPAAASQSVCQSVSQVDHYVGTVGLHAELLLCVAHACSQGMHTDKEESAFDRFHPIEQLYPIFGQAVWGFCAANSFRTKCSSSQLLFS